MPHYGFVMKPTESKEIFTIGPASGKPMARHRRVTAMKKGIKTAVTVELTPTEVILVNAYRDEHGCSRMAAIRALIRGAHEEQRTGREVQLLGARIDTLTVSVNGIIEILQQLVSTSKDIRLGTAFSEIAIEELHRDNPMVMERIRQRYESFKR